jgi:hypothetical protein
MIRLSRKYAWYTNANTANSPDNINNNNRSGIHALELYIVKKVQCGCQLVLLAR